MLHVEFDPSKLPPGDRVWWDKWLARADQARGRVSGGRVEYDPAVWAQLKGWLGQHVFNGKCAYCEYGHLASYVGKAEHYRPKDGFLGTASGHARWHPGYYWVAYDWRNFLPACAQCNGPHGRKSEFPVKADNKFDPREGPDTVELDRVEKPLLLHPYRDDPSKHLKFGKLGMVAGRTPEGEQSIEDYGLSRYGLNAARQARQEMALHFYKQALWECAQGASLAERMATYTGPKAEFSQAVLGYITIAESDETAAA